MYVNKSDLRNLYTEKRSHLTPNQISEKSQRILKHLQQMDIWSNSVYHIFVQLSQKKEIDTWLILEYLFQKNKSVVVPKIQNEQMISCQIDKNSNWEMGKFNIPEPQTYQLIDPKKIDVVFLPMLICDVNGNRIGYGKGNYDTFLKSCKNEVLKIGLNFYPPLEKIEDVSAWDVPLDYCVTPEEIVSFGS